MPGVSSVTSVEAASSYSSPTSMNDSLLDELEKADVHRHDVYDPNASYQPLLEEHNAESDATALKNQRSRSAEDAEALWAELHSHPPQDRTRESPSSAFKFRSQLAQLTSNIRPPTASPQFHSTSARGSHGGANRSPNTHPVRRNFSSPHSTTPASHTSVDVRRHLKLPSLADVKNNWLLTSRGRHVPDEFGHVENVDAFLIALYNYYYHNGMSCYIGKEGVQLLNLLFTVCMSSFLMGCIQWRELATCPSSPNGCKRPLSDFVTWQFEGHWTSTVVLFYFLIFFAFWITRVVAFISNARDAYDMHGFVVEKLRIDARQIQTITWNEVVDRVVALLPPSADQSKPLKPTPFQSSYQLQIDPTQLGTPLAMARRIMRKDNFMIAFMNAPVFHTALPVPSWLPLSSHAVFSRNMEFNLQLCILDPMFDPIAGGSLRALSADDLKKRLMAVGMVNLLLTPFLLLFRAIQFFLLGAQEWSVNRASYLSSRRWSPLAMWTFREYNELPHVFDARIEKAAPLAEAYLALFPSGLVSIVASGVAFFAGSIMAVLIFMSLVEESIVLEVEVGSRQLIWYFTIASGVFALARSFQSPQCHTFATRDALLALFPYKTVLFLEECLIVLLTPFVLCVSLADAAPEIVRFIEDHTVTVPDVGAVCRFAEFDFKADGGEAKMESSFMNFKRHHPSWHGPQEGEDLVNEITRFRGQELEKSLRLGDTLGGPDALLSRTMMMGDSMFHSTAFGGGQLSQSQQLMQSHAIHMALNGPQSSDHPFHEDEAKEDMQASLTM
ncbi:hypothetical protein DYB32_005965 [Aphanomyces invadans]|uniref:Autophagy-related protein 9 n=1 Tax=Aphanomyces invadans TaxID=157072 RepID=A0A3R6WK47_9STRA|nr:hypothetical protein DYB32_005965 [Aphanomyces invadans]